MESVLSHGLLVVLVVSRVGMVVRMVAPPPTMYALYFPLRLTVRACLGR